MFESTYSINIDSLILTVKDKPGKEQFNLLKDYLNTLYDTNPAEMQKLGKYVLELSNVKENGKSYATLLNLMANSYYFQGKNKEALEYYNKAYEQSLKIKDTKKQSHILTNIASVYNAQGRYLKALDIFFKVLKIYEKTNDLEGFSLTYYNMGTTYYYSMDFKNSFKFFQYALDKAIQLKDSIQIANSISGLGLASWGADEYDKAIEYYAKSKVISEKIKNEAGLLYIYNSLAVIYQELGKRDEAFKYYSLVIPLAEKLGDLEIMCSARVYLGEFYLNNKQYKFALKELLKGYAIADTILQSNLRKKEAAEGLYKAYQELGDSKEALYYCAEALSLRDSLFVTERDDKVAELNAQFETEKREKEILKLQTAKKTNELELLRKENDISKQQRILIVVAIILLAAIIIGALIYNRYKLKQEAFGILESKNKEISLQKELIEEKQSEIVDSINYAKRIQNALLAHDSFLNKILPDHFVLFQPKDIVSGDFYWATEHNNLIYLAVCDSTGHGVPGAFMSLLNIGFLSEAIKERNIQSPALVLDYVRERLIQNLTSDEQKDGMDAILICMDKNNGKITYAAANNSPLICHNNEPVHLEYDKMPVGKGERNEPFRSFEIEAEKGSMLYLYTDGYADQFGGPKGKKFKYRQLNELLWNIKDLPLNEQKSKLDAAFDQWKGDLEQVDDVCVIGIRL